MTDGKKVERILRSRFQGSGDAEDARSQKAYMKSALDFHGVSAAEVRGAARDLLTENPRVAALDHDGLVALVDDLFASRFFDVRSTSLVMLERKAPMLGARDLPWLIALVRRARCWAHVDLIATHLVGGVVTKSPGSLRWLSRWAADDDFWVRRTALLAQERELRRGRGDFELFERIAAPMLAEREFFIRKAIGWVLRETSKKRPELSYRFLAKNLDRASGLTLREGAKYLPPAMRSSLGLDPKGSAVRTSRG